MPSLVVQSSHTSWMGALNVRSRVNLGRVAAKLLPAAVRVLQLRDVELLHLQHRLHGRPRIAGLRVGEELAEHRRDDLPRQSELVLQPPARAFLAAVSGELAPVPVDLRLRLAGHHEREALGERERRSAVERRVFAPIQLEHGVEHLALRNGSVGFAEHEVQHLRVREQRDVELDGLFAPVAEHDARPDLSRNSRRRHRLFSFELILFFSRRSSSAASLSSRLSQMARYPVTHSDSSRNRSGRSAYSRRRPSGRTITKLASSRICSCRDTPGCPMSTTWTSSLTERSPSRSASTIRRRVGSARIWNTSGTTTYYSSNICLVNNMRWRGE